MLLEGYETEGVTILKINKKWSIRSWWVENNIITVHKVRVEYVDHRKYLVDYQTVPVTKKNNSNNRRNY